MHKIKNKLYLATEKAAGTNYENICVYIYGNDDYGTEGLILNPKVYGYVYYDLVKKVFILDVKNSDLQQDSNIKCYPLYLGGNSATSGIFFIHGYKEHSHLSVSDMNGFLKSLVEPKPKKYTDEKLKIHEDIYFGTPSTFYSIQESNLNSEKFRFYTGHMTWDYGIFEQEVQNGYWIEIESKKEFFYDLNILNEKLNTEKTLFTIFQSPYIGFDPIWN